MRVAHIITRMIVGGAQENTLLTCRDLIETYGDDVLLITGPAIGPEGDLLAGQGSGGVPCRLIPNLRREIHPFRDLRAYGDLIRVLREFRPDVVHTHSAKAGVLGREAAWKVRVPAIVHTVHGAPFHAYQPWIARGLFRVCERRAARRCHQIVCVADAMTDLLVAHRVAPRAKCVTIHSGMDTRPFLDANRNRDATRRSLGFADDQIVVGNPARLFRLKGHSDVVDAARGLVRAFPRVRFLFVGDGVLREACEQRIRGAGLESYFVFTGLVPPSRIPDLIGAMDVLVHASLREGLARALPQTLLAGKPVVSYDIDGAREVVLDGITGFLVPPRSIAGLESALARLVADPSLRARFGSEGRNRFAERFDHRAMTGSLRDVYARLLSRAGGLG